MIRTSKSHPLQIATVWLHLDKKEKQIAKFTEAERCYG